MRKMKDAFAMIKCNIRALLAFEVFINIFVITFLTPMFLGLMQLAMHLADIEYLTNTGFMNFIKEPSTVGLLFILLTAFVVFILFEMVAIMYCFQKSKEKKKVYVTDMIIVALKKIWSMMLGSNLRLILFIPMLYLVITFPSILQELSSYNLKCELRNMNIPWQILVVLLVILSGVVLVRVQSICVFMFENVRFSEASGEGFRRGKKRTVRFMLSFAIWNVLIVIAAVLLFLIFLFFTAMILKQIVARDTAYSWTLFAGREVYKVLMIIFSGTLIPWNLSLIVAEYYDCAKKSAIEIPKSKEHKRYAILKYPKYIMCALIWGMLLFYFFIGDNVRAEYVNIELLRSTSVVAHRGGALYVPENTLAAVNYCIDNHLDYVEIDVQSTSDGVVVLLHDESLERTTGYNANLRDVPYSIVKKLDAGSFYNEEYAGERIPTLEEVLDEAKGRICLLVEIKNHEKNDMLIQNVVKLINVYDMVDECVIQSFDRDVIRKVKKCDENIKTSLLTSAVYGNFESMTDCDAISLNYRYASRTVVSRIHEAGKEVFLWTVNNKDQIRYTISFGADYVITDRPVLASEMITKYEVNPWLVSVVKYLIHE